MNRSFDPFDAAAAIMVCATGFAYLNHRLGRLPRPTALMLMGAFASIAVVALDTLLPAVHAGHVVRDFLEGIDFRATLMNGMLSFLLFAGALHIDLHEIRRLRMPIAIITVFGVLASTLLVGSGAWLVAFAVGVHVPLGWALLFGALISPTDPVAVLGVLKSAHVPAALEATVAGESLFNDGVALVAFSILLGLVSGSGDANLLDAARLFAVQAVGGALFGAALGWTAFAALRPIDEHNLEVMITLALVMGGYALAQHLGVSGPIAMAVAGLIIGNQGRARAMSGLTRDYVTKFWSLVDEILNAVLFLMIGLEAIVILGALPLLLFGLAAIPLVMVARASSVGLPMLILGRRLPHGSYLILVLGGVRGGVSIALALSLPWGAQKEVILAATYAVVLFSMLVQAPLVGAAARRLYTGQPQDTGAAFRS